MKANDLLRGWTLWSGRTVGSDLAATTMTFGALSGDQVYHALLDQIGAGMIEVGSKLPSCRALAAELGTNASTVNRAIQRLERRGLVRSEPRVGTFLLSAGTVALERGEVEGSIRDAVTAARQSGFTPGEIRQMLEASLSLGTSGSRNVVFVECNNADLVRMARLIESTTGVRLHPLLLDDLGPGWEEGIDVVVAPMFHLADLMDQSIDLDRVVEINFNPAASALRELSTLRSPTKIAVVAPSERGVVRMQALVSQYYPGPILTAESAHDPVLTKVDVIVHPRAITLSEELIATVDREIVIDWEIDPSSAASLLVRIASVLPR